MQYNFILYPLILFIYNKDENMKKDGSLVTIYVNTPVVLNQAKVYN